MQTLHALRRHPYTTRLIIRDHLYAVPLLHLATTCDIYYHLGWSIDQTRSPFTLIMHGLYFPRLRQLY